MLPVRDATLVVERRERDLVQQVVRIVLRAQDVVPDVVTRRGHDQVADAVVVPAADSDNAPPAVTLSESPTVASDAFDDTFTPTAPANAIDEPELSFAAGADFVPFFAFEPEFVAAVCP